MDENPRSEIGGDERPSRGIPLYVRDGASPLRNAGQAGGGGRWIGANDAATKLLQCLEAVRDMTEQVCLLTIVPASERTPRQVKQLSVPLIALLDGTIALLNFLLNDKDCRLRLAPIDIRKLERAQAAIKGAGLVPKSDLHLIRNKTAAHIDVIAANNPAEIWKHVDLERFAHWGILLAAAISNALVCDVYAWTESGTPDEWWHLMSVDGTLLHLYRENPEDFGTIAAVTDVQSPKIALSDELLMARAAWIKIMGWRDSELVMAPPDEQPPSRWMPVGDG